MRGFIWLMLYWFVGELAVRALHIPLPGQIVGMGLLLASLFLGVLKVEDVREAADFLLKHMMLLFVPVVVGAMAYYPAMIANWLPVAAAITLGTLGVLAIAGGTATLVGRSKRKERSAAHDLAS